MTVSRVESRPAVEDLLDDPRSITRLRVLRSARQLIAERGLVVSMADLADAAGLGRRTLFRYFDSHDELIAAALDSALDWYEQEVDVAVSSDAPLAAWVDEVVHRVLDAHSNAGRGLWELASSFNDDLSPALVAVNRRRRDGRSRMTNLFASAAWTRAGGRGAVPPSVVDAVGLTMSSFTNRSMIDDLGRDATSLARSISTLLLAVLRVEADASALASKARQHRS